MSNEPQTKAFIMKKTKTYMDKLMENKEFREKFDKIRNIKIFVLGKKLPKFAIKQN